MTKVTTHTGTTSKSFDATTLASLPAPCENPTFVVGLDAHGRAWISYDDNIGGRAAAHIESLDSYFALVEHFARVTGSTPEEMRLYNSSSIDFPEEYTDDPAAIALARALQN